MNITHFKLYTTNYAQKTVHCKFYTANFTLQTTTFLFRTRNLHYSVNIKLLNIYCRWYIVNYTLQIVNCTLHLTPSRLSCPTFSCSECVGELKSSTIHVTYSYSCFILNLIHHLSPCLHPQVPSQFCFPGLKYCRCSSQSSQDSPLCSVQ